MGAEFREDAAGEPQVPRVACHLLADGRHAQRRDAEPVARIDHPRQVVQRLTLVHTPDVALDGHGGRIQANGVLNVHADALVAHVVLQDRGPRTDAKADGLVGLGRYAGPQGTRVHIRQSTYGMSGTTVTSIRSRPVVGPIRYP